VCTARKSPSSIVVRCRRPDVSCVCVLAQLHVEVASLHCLSDVAARCCVPYAVVHETSSTLAVSSEAASEWDSIHVEEDICDRTESLGRSAR